MKAVEILTLASEQLVVLEGLYRSTPDAPQESRTEMILLWPLSGA